VVDEAIQKNCNLIVAHHPIVFRGLKKLNGRNYVERVVIKAIKNDVALYAAHTNLDNIAGGVSYKIAEKLGLATSADSGPEIGPPDEVGDVRTNRKGETRSIREATQAVLDALYAAGVGQIGRYAVIVAFGPKGRAHSGATTSRTRRLVMAGEDTTALRKPD
jgi:putative NIF3 family GTP cyclohydrolase 1 type 2